MITKQQEEILHKYASLKKEINVLDKQAEDLKEEVGNILQMNDLGEVNIGNDKIVIGNTPKWTFTNKVTELEDAVKDQKALAKRLGDATKVDNFYPKFMDSDNKKEKVYD